MTLVKSFEHSLRVVLGLALLASSLFVGAGLSGVSAAEREAYFPETGYAVKGAFLAFFEQNGGLTVFGYPRSDELVEDGREVQYFQRARFEEWPENREPYKVQLMLIGDVVMGPADPPVHASDPSVGRAAASDPSRRYFPETGHTVAYAFLDFFDRNGGTLVFGYPTSEMYAVDGRLVQRFQRARFEWHLENPDPYKVQLGLLGDEYLAGMGRALAGPVQATAAPGPAGTGVPDQGKLAIMLAAGGDIVVVDPDGTGLRRVTRGLDPAWSPDGKKLAVTRWEDPPGVYVVDFETGKETLVHRVEGARSPAWSPDGAKIAFQEPYVENIYVRRGGSLIAVPNQRYRISAASLFDGEAVGLPSALHSYSPAWSPDGISILFKGDRGLYMTDAANGLRQVPGTDTRYLFPAWSPDGKRIAFAWKQHDHTEISLINWDGSGFQNLTRTQDLSQKASDNVSPVWSPDGTRIAFVTNREGDWKVYVMDTDGSNQTRLLDLPVIYQAASERIVAWGR